MADHADEAEMENNPRPRDDVSRKTRQKKQEGVLDSIRHRPLRCLRMLIEGSSWVRSSPMASARDFGHGLGKVSKQHYLKFDNLWSAIVIRGLL
ncbi:PREDICTED: probable folate-biopterin transporter 3 isoform X2 [Tarenaya hassleriana]|uniref:probable folate-biopterin transporter 3 isoform X2 n=1 Tax=Tarenaya hassleriana TaxID=28532 RepID=UPI00053C9C7D|nr:PREDICTED: probable folate-biopterin transporter 3 isoform X2 [Tarenaya hassleriana]